MTKPNEQNAVQTEQPSLIDAEIAQHFHEAYERLAPSFGYETREASRRAWANVPANNKALMTAVVAEVRALLAQRQDSDKDAERYRKAIAYEDNAGLLYCAVMNHCPDKAAIDAEFDAEAIDVGAIANGAPK